MCLIATHFIALFQTVKAARAGKATQTLNYFPTSVLITIFDINTFLSDQKIALGGNVASY